MRAYWMVLLLATTSACSPTPFGERDVSRMEAKIAMPPGAAPLDQYARFYSPPRVHTESSLPFTTITDPIPNWPEPRTKPVVVAVFVQSWAWGRV